MTGDSALAELARTFEQIEGQLAGARDPGAALVALVDIAAAQVPHAERAGITRGQHGSFDTPAASDDLVRRIDAIQYEVGSGPCVDASVEDAVFNAGDLRTDPRWPEFGRRAHEAAGVVSMLSHRLYLERDPDVIAALNFYSAEVAAFDPDSEAMALVLATLGASAVTRAAAQTQVDNLERALLNSREIGIAIGVLMNQHKITREQAFDLLRIVSQGTQRKLADIAAEVADTGVLPAARIGRTTDR